MLVLVEVPTCCIIKHAETSRTNTFLRLFLFVLENKAAWCIPSSRLYHCGAPLAGLLSCYMCLHRKLVAIQSLICSALITRPWFTLCIFTAKCEVRCFCSQYRTNSEISSVPNYLVLVLGLHLFGASVDILTGYHLAHGLGRWLV